MMLMIGLVLAGFAVGTLLTGLVACYVFGLLHAEAVRVFDGQGAAFALLLHSPGQAGKTS